MYVIILSFSTVRIHHSLFGDVKKLITDEFEAEVSLYGVAVFHAFLPVFKMSDKAMVHVHVLVHVI